MDSHKRKSKKKKSRPIKKLESCLECSDPPFQKYPREEKGDGHPPDGSLWEQYSNHGSKQLHGAGSLQGLASGRLCSMPWLPNILPQLKETQVFLVCVFPVLNGH